MAGRRLHPEERALWGQVAATVRPLPGKSAPLADQDAPVGHPTAASSPGRPPGHPLPTETRPARRPADYLDSGWERRIRAGALVPDRAIDLHGHTLASAHRHFETALAAAVRDGARVLLVVTGKERPAPMAGERARGAIRAEIGHWIAGSPHADAIASVRRAHQRHGGAGALYLILRRR